MDEDKGRENGGMDCGESGGYEIPVRLKDGDAVGGPSEIAEEKTPPADAGKEDEAMEAQKVREPEESHQDKIARLEEQIKRISAEFENFRRRQEKRYDESVKYAAESVITEFLPVLDSIRLAHNSAASEKDFNQLLKGLEMTGKQLEDTMKKLGVEEIESVGQSFDPAFHHAVMAEETDEYPDQHIIEEFQKGYKYKDRVIRPGMVKVARNQ